MQARWYRTIPGGLRCELCPHLCAIAPGQIGRCGARRNEDGRLISLNYGQICASQVDAIEKKPVFHYLPGAKLLSVGTFGCNLDCDFCQNSVMAHPERPMPARYVPPEELVNEAKEKGVVGIAFTYNEPIIWAEYILDVVEVAAGKGLFVMLNSNGEVQGEAREDLLNGIDVIKVDIKGFSEKVYHDMCHGDLGTVLQTCQSAMDKGIHLELSYLMVPGITDDDAMLSHLAEFILEELGPEVPLHLFRFEPDLRMIDVPEESQEKMEIGRAILRKKGLRYVYLGGMGDESSRDTFCPHCGETLVSRTMLKSEPVMIKKDQVSRFCPSYGNASVFLKDGHCPTCGERSPIVDWIR
jgi:pyruvate formate lyase activating enzyme